VAAGYASEATRSLTLATTVAPASWAVSTALPTREAARSAWARALRTSASGAGGVVLTTFEKRSRRALSSCSTRVRALLTSRSSDLRAVEPRRSNC
jgi:hypothetical protein